MKKTHKITSISLVVAIFLFSLGSAFAQNFTNNTGGTYTAGACQAVIKMKSTSSAFAGTAQLGTGAANRIQGIVDWAGGAGQTVQALYYTNLFVSGTGTKTIADGVHVSGEGCSTAFSAYSQLQTAGVGYYATSGDRTYTGTFYYDGAGQTIFAEGDNTGTINNYVNLDLSGTGTKTNNAAVYLRGDLTVNTGSPLVANGDFEIIGTGASTAAANVTVNSGADFTTTGTGTFTVNDLVDFAVDGTLNLNSTGHFTVTGPDGELNVGTAGLLALGANSYLDVAGDFTNDQTTPGSRTNMTFDITSTVAYTGSTAQTLLGNADTDPTNNYGILVFSGAGDKTADGNVYTKSTISIAGGSGDIIMGSDCASATNTMFVDATTSNKISFTGVPDDGTYIRGNVELRKTIATGVTYTMNSYETRVTFTTAPTTFAMNHQSGVAPSNLADFSNTTDITRCVTTNFTGTGTLSQLRVGYEPTNDQVGTIDQSLLRFVEGYNSAENAQKITGGAGIATNSGAAATTHWVNIGGTIDLIAAAGGGTTGQISSGSNIVLTSKPLEYIATTNGRWTNPNTWDEGAVPPPTANTRLRALVYAGIDGPAYGTGALNNTTDERTHYGIPSGTNEITIANSITIDDGATYADASLIIGNEDNENGAILRTQVQGTLGGIAAGVYNDNAVANTSNDVANTKTNDPGSMSINGLFITNLLGTGYTSPVTFGTAQITNAGTITNWSVIELGN